MSTATQEATFINRTEDVVGGPDSRFAPYSGAEQPGGEPEGVIRYMPVKQRQSHPQKKMQSRVLRRFTGFLVDVHGAEARVAFVSDGQRILYDLPADQLRRSGIESKNQPFQMDEVEIETEEGLVVGYRFEPLAKPSDAYIEPLNFDEDRKRKRDLILKEFGKAES